MFAPNAFLPTAVLLSAVVFTSNAPEPTAVLLSPVVLSFNAFKDFPITFFLF